MQVFFRLFCPMSNFGFSLASLKFESGLVSLLEETLRMETTKRLRHSLFARGLKRFLTCVSLFQVLQYAGNFRSKVIQIQRRRFTPKSNFLLIKAINSLLSSLFQRKKQKIITKRGFCMPSADFFALIFFISQAKKRNKIIEFLSFADFCLFFRHAGIFR